MAVQNNNFKKKVLLMISSLIPYFLKTVIYSIPLCGLIWLYNLVFDGSIDVWWGVFAAVMLSPMGSKTDDSEEEQPKEG